VTTKTFFFWGGGGEQNLTEYFFTCLSMTDLIDFKKSSPVISAEFDKLSARIISNFP